MGNCSFVAFALLPSTLYGIQSPLISPFARLWNGQRYHVFGRISPGTLCLKILKKFLLLSLRADVNFETFADAFLPLENCYKFFPILFDRESDRTGP